MDRQTDCKQHCLAFNFLTPKFQLFARRALAAFIVVGLHNAMIGARRNLHEALTRGDMEATESLMRFHVRADDADLSASLRMCVERLDRQSVERLLYRYPEIPLNDALLGACGVRSPSMVSLLLAHGANAECIDRVGATALSYCYSQSPAWLRRAACDSPAEQKLLTCETIRLMRRAGARLTLAESIEFGVPEDLELAISQGGDVDSFPGGGVSPLRYACTQYFAHDGGPEAACRARIVGILKRHGAHEFRFAIADSPKPQVR